jgi:hypothetical protein
VIRNVGRFVTVWGVVFFFFFVFFQLFDID